MDASIASFATDELRMLNRLKNGPEIQHSQPNSGSAPVHFEEGSTLNHGKARANVGGPPRVENSNLHNQSTVSIIQPYP